MKRKTKTAKPSPAVVGPITMLMVIQERNDLRDALLDLMAFWNRRKDRRLRCGWTIGDGQRLEEIRKLVAGL